MSLPVFLAPPQDLAALHIGSTYVLAGQEGHHAAIVQRRQVGEELEIVDGAGHRLSGVITQVAGREVSIAVSALQREDPAHPRITIVQGLIKGGGDEAIAAMTEAGVDEIIPWQAQRSIAKWPASKAQRARLKWQATAREATKQARRAYIPRVRDVVQNQQLTEEIRQATRAAAQDGPAQQADAPASKTLVLIAHEGSADGLIHSAGLPNVGQVWCIIGPEGGISEAELEQFTAAGARPISLGPHVLRARNAGLVATSLLRALTADRKAQ